MASSKEKPEVSGPELVEVVEREDFETFQTLLKSGPDEYLVSEEDWSELTPFLWASRKGHEKLLQKLISDGADVNQNDDHFPGKEHDSILLSQN